MYNGGTSQEMKSSKTIKAIEKALSKPKQIIEQQPVENKHISKIILEKLQNKIDFETSLYLGIDKSFFNSRDFKKLSPKTKKRTRKNFDRVNDNAQQKMRTDATADYLKTMKPLWLDSTMSQKTKSFSQVNMYVKKNIEERRKSQVAEKKASLERINDSKENSQINKIFTFNIFLNCPYRI